MHDAVGATDIDWSVLALWRDNGVTMEDGVVVHRRVEGVRLLDDPVGSTAGLGRKGSPPMQRGVSLPCLGDFSDDEMPCMNRRTDTRSDSGVDIGYRKRSGQRSSDASFFPKVMVDS